MTSASLPTIDAPLPPSSELNSKVLKVLESYLAELQGGRLVNPDELLARHPELAGPLREYLTSLEFLHRAALSIRGTDQPPQTAAGPTAPEMGTLGDFRILREIGRGGMGIVYEAIQISLGRRVALKVLPFASTLDAKQMQRFKNEAQAAAGLHHTNIVPVHATGCERGVHYYAMQFIEGQTLAALIQQLRQLEAREGEGLNGKVHVESAETENQTRLEPCPAASLASELASGRWAAAPQPSPSPLAGQEQQEANPQPTGPYSVPPFVPPYRDGLGVADAPAAESTPPPAAISTEQSTKKPAFFRTVANLGAQAANALEHAHQLGVIHRDIKPANLMVDARGNLWITDFGLAHCQGACELTMSGDLLGTLRYMSPEQALAKRIIVDERTDIYSLGVTLYELLTLEPAFPGTDRQQVLGKIAFEDPKPPRRFNKAIPTELETIVLKAMEKNPQDRYATAQLLADDLQRFLADEPIRARRPTLWLKAKKWSRRNRPVVWTAAGAWVVLLVLALAGSLLSVSFIKDQRDLAFRSELTAKQRLCDSLIAQAQAGRWSGLAGQRYGGLQALVEATRIARELDSGEEAILKLRNEAIACMSLPDLRRRPEYDIYTAEETGGVIESQLQRYAVVDDQGDIIIRRIPDDEEVICLKGHGARATRMEFSPNGQYLAAFYPRDPEGKRGQAFIWDLKLGDVVLRSPPEFADPGLDWSPDSRRFSLHYSSPVRQFAVYDVDLRKEIQRFSTPPLYATVFDPNGRRIAIATGEGVQIRDVETGSLLDQFTFPVPVKRLAWGCDGRFLAGSYAETLPEIEGWKIYMWDTQARRFKALEGHRNTPVHIAFNHAGTLLASNGWDGTIRLWNPWTGKEVLRTEGDWGPLWFSPDDRFLDVGVGWGRARHCWELTTGHEYRQLFTPAETTISWANIKFSPDGCLLAAECNDGARLWDVASGKHAAWLSPDRSALFGFDPSGKYFVTRGNVGNYRWPLALKEDQLKRKLRIGPPEKISPEAPTTERRDGRLASPDGRWLVASSNEGVRIWDARNGKPMPNLTERGGSYWFSPDSKWLAVGCDKEYLFWQVDSWTLCHRFLIKDPASASAPAFVAFSADSQLAALYHSAWEIRLIHLPTGREVATLPNHEACPLSNFAFSPDGTQLAAATRTNIIQLWDLAAVRERLKTMDLDWDLPPYRAAGPRRDVRSLQVEGDLGHMVAREKYSMILAFFPFHAEAYYQRGCAYRRFGQSSEAFSDLNMAIALKADHAEAHYERGLLRDKEGPQEAITDFSRAIALRPDYPDAYFERGRAHEYLKMFDRALVDFSKALESKRDDPEVLVHRGNCYMGFEQWQKAAADFSKAVQLKPDWHLSRHCLGQAYLSLAEWDQAAANLSKAIETDSSCLPAWLDRGAAYMALSQSDRAIADFAKAIEMKPDEPQFHYYLALARLAAGDITAYRGECAAMLQRFGQTDKPEHAHWVAWTCVLYPDAVKDYGQPVQLAEKALRGDPKTYNFSQTFGAALYRSGRFEQAVERLNETNRAWEQAAIKPASFSPAYTWFFLAMAHYRLSQADEARQWLDKACKQIDEETQNKALPWNRRSTLQLLRREAETLLNGSGEGQPTSKKEKPEAKGDLSRLQGMTNQLVSQETMLNPFTQSLFRQGFQIRQQLGQRQRGAGVLNGFVFILAFVCGQTGVRAETPKVAEIGRLITQLGSEKFTEREAASRRLDAVGEPALAPLRKALTTSEDPEIQHRARKLIEAIGRRVFAQVRRIAWHDQIQGIPAHIYHTTFSPDSRSYVAGGDIGPLRLWDVATGGQLQEFKGHDGWTSSAVFTPDGKRLLSAGTDKLVRLWDVATGRPIRIFAGHTEAVHSVAVSPDGRLALSGSHDKTLRLWDVETGKEVRRMEGHTGWCGGIFSPDGSQALSFSADKTLRLWDVDSGKQIQLLEGHTGEVCGAFFMPDGRQVLSYAGDFTLRAWDVQSGKEVWRHNLGRDHCAIRWLAITPDGQRFLTNHQDLTIRLHDLATGRELYRLEMPVGASPQGLSVSPDGRYVADGSYRGFVDLFRLGGEERL